MTKVKAFNTDHIKTVEVKVDPPLKSKRNWLNIGFGLLFGAIASPEVQSIVSEKPFLAAGLGILASALNLFLTTKSKTGVVSKNVVLINE